MSSTTVGDLCLRFVKRVQFALSLGVASCAADPYSSYEAIAAPDAVNLISGNTIVFAAAADPRLQTMIHFAANGGGWRDARLTPGTVPQPRDMAMIVAWSATEGGGICLWSTPLIGAMPSGAAPQQECLRIFREPAPGALLAATISDLKRETTAPLQLYDGNIFPPTQIAKYETQVRVLYGGQLPSWTIP